MPAQVRVIWDDEFTNYDFGPTQPMAPVRLDLTARLCVELGLFDAPGVEVVGAKVADDALIATVHEPAYVAAVRRASLDPDQADQARGLGTTDDPAFVGIHESSARILQGTVDLAEAIWTGAVLRFVVSANTSSTLENALPTPAAAESPMFGLMPASPPAASESSTMPSAVVASLSSQPRVRSPSRPRSRSAPKR